MSEPDRKASDWAQQARACQDDGDFDAAREASLAAVRRAFAEGLTIPNEWAVAHRADQEAEKAFSLMGDTPEGRALHEEALQYALAGLNAFEG